MEMRAYFNNVTEPFLIPLAVMVDIHLEPGNTGPRKVLCPGDCMTPILVSGSAVMVCSIDICFHGS